MKSRKHLSAKGLFEIIYNQFKKIKPSNETVSRSNAITLTDCLMSGLAMFSLKFPSLLKFDEGKSEDEIKHNLRTLFHVKQAPSDTYMRERNDEADPKEIRKAYKKILAEVQRGKGLEEFTYVDGHYLLAGDGTGFFTSHSVYCKNCCIKHYNKCRIKFVFRVLEDLSNYKKNTYLLVKNAQVPWMLYFIDHEKQKIQIEISAIAGLQAILANKTKKDLTKKEKKIIEEKINSYYRIDHPDDATYYHNMFCAAIVHPNKKIVLPLAPEPIMKEDGATKNDCERNAAKRLYTDTRREHPHLKFIVVEDSLSSNVPHLSDLKALNMRYIVGAKPGDHKFLFDLLSKSECKEYSYQTDDGTMHRYRYINQVQMNNSHPDFKTNFIEYWETDKNGKQQHFSWVTDILITYENIHQIMRGGRARWRIENNTFNTLKNQGYHFSHNYGHGYKNLSTVFGMLIMLAFFVDQVQELSCFLFKKARAKFKSRTSLWEHMRALFCHYSILSWDDLFNAIAHGANKPTLIPNTS